MNFKTYQYWFYAAAVYNFLWGVINILFPESYFNLIEMSPPKPQAIWQVVGMFVLVYAPAYWWAARYPERHPHLIVIGLLGKFLGPIGFVFSVLMGQLPLAFGWTLLTNDLIWWIPFSLYLRDMSKSQGGFIRLLLGE